MNFEHIRTKMVDGIPWFRADDLARFFHLPGVNAVSKTLKLYPEYTRLIIETPHDWRFRFKRLYISVEGVLILANRFGDIPMRKLREWKDSVVNQ